ncbi:cytochrome P450 [Pisolithus marmoratus]|nr:cytochrome P450 [Pisolithus marmoratus]
MDISPTNSYILAALCIAASTIILKQCKSSKLDHIPYIGYPTWLGTYVSAFKYVRNAAQILEEGCAKYKDTPFKVPALGRWIVVVGRRHLEDIKRLTDHELSLVEASNDSLNLDHLVGSEVIANHYHISVARVHFARSLAPYYPDMKDEICTAFDELLDLRDDEWKSVLAVKTVCKIICRASNRVFVGLPLCRDPDWIDITSRFTTDVATDGIILNMFPKLLVPVVSKILSNAPTNVRRAMKLLDVTIRERVRCMREHGGEWNDKPNDILQWLIDEKRETTTQQLTPRILMINFGAIHSPTETFIHALYYLAAHPQYIKLLREEVDTVIKEYGWTKEAIAQMWRVDSFLAETERLQGFAASVQRKAMKDLTLSDGTFIPKGTHISVPTYVIHRDSAVYENPTVFDPLRFYKLRRSNGNGSTKHQMVAVNEDYLAFGYGRHACPGRFLAAYELKTMLAHVVISYDIKFLERNTRPISTRWDIGVMSDPTVRVMFRKRTND